MRDPGFISLVANRALLAALAAVASSQLVKVLAPLVHGRAPDPRRFADYGGFPSAHSAFISACAFEIGLVDGFSSGLFALAVVSAAVIISDILRLRSTVERSKADIDILFERTGLARPGTAPQFRSHSPFEVVAGIVWGCLCAYVVFVFG
ncbi:MAG TPA: divergent PAP2 family protein [Rectinemataceae bacterium]|nr:divergent PAP2 family protein [Rectinemataceae bacterium]